MVERCSVANQVSKFVAAAAAAAAAAAVVGVMGRPERGLGLARPWTRININIQTWHKNLRVGVPNATCNTNNTSIASNI